MHPNLGHGLTWASSPGSRCAGSLCCLRIFQELCILHKRHHLSKGDGQAQSRGLGQHPDAKALPFSLLPQAGPPAVSSPPTYLCSLFHTFWPGEPPSAFLAQVDTKHSKCFLTKPKQTNTRSLSCGGSDQQGPLAPGPRSKESLEQSELDWL